jgi:8-oxo-dGTP pyrophosphatase MutT (NUDIX family)
MAISAYLKNLREKVGHEILQIPSVAAILRDENERILFVKSVESGIWCLPAGAIDLGETPSEAVEREVFEETGLQVKPTRIISVCGGRDFRFVYPNGDAVEYFIVVFECHITGGQLFARDGEVSELRYFPAEEIPDLAIPYPKSIFARGSKETYF